MSIHWGGRGAGHVSRWSLATTGAPSLALNFLSGALDPRITFTRGTTATFVGSNGFIQTAAIDAPRFDYDPVTLAPKGLLIEEARTNILLYSDQFDDINWLKNVGTTVTANTTVAPDGTSTADTINPAANVVELQRQQTLTAGTYTLSVWLSGSGTMNIGFFNAIDGVQDSATITLTGTLTRYSLTKTLSAGLNSIYPVTTRGAATVTSLVMWGAQLEAGAFATSYIPTVASAVPRNADAATMTGTNFSSWYNPTEGTFVVNGSTLTSVNASVPAFLTVSDGTNPNYSAIFADDSAGRPQFVAFVSSVNQFDLKNLSFTNTANVPFSAAGAYKVNDFAMSTNGSAVATDALGTMPTVNQFGVGCRHGNSRFLNGHLRQIRYYNTRLPNTSLQTLTV